MEPLTELVIAHRKHILTVAKNLCRGDLQAAEDIAQIATMKAIFSPSPLRDFTKVKGWLAIITKNAALNYFKNNIQFVPLEDYDPVAPTPIERDARIHEVLKQVDKLPEKQREALDRHIYEDKSFSEISTENDIPYNTAKANFRHAVEKIRNKLH